MELGQPNEYQLQFSALKIDFPSFIVYARDKKTIPRAELIMYVLRVDQISIPRNNFLMLNRIYDLCIRALRKGNSREMKSTYFTGVRRRRIPPRRVKTNITL